MSKGNSVDEVEAVVAGRSTVVPGSSSMMSSPPRVPPSPGPFRIERPARHPAWGAFSHRHALPCAAGYAPASGWSGDEPRTRTWSADCSPWLGADSVSPHGLGHQGAAPRHAGLLAPRGRRNREADAAGPSAAQRRTLQGVTLPPQAA